MFSQTVLTEEALELSSIAGLVANVCDHAEHNEPASYADVRLGGERLRAVALRLADELGRSATSLYRDRLRAIEERNVLHYPGGFDGAALISDEATWRELQLIQLDHDRFYHPDVIGLTKADQLRHFALHLAKLSGAAADALSARVSHDDFAFRRAPDALLFGVKLATVTGEKLSETPVNTVGEHRRQPVGLGTSS